MENILRAGLLRVPDDDVGWEFVGSEGLSIDCWKGRFEAARRFSARRLVYDE